MIVTTTHEPGECRTCDAYRIALAGVTDETAARSPGSSCIGLAQRPPHLTPDLPSGILTVWKSPTTKGSMMKTITAYQISVPTEDDPNTYAIERLDIPADDTLSGLQAAVGGYIEAIPADESLTIWVNEEGKYQTPTRNLFAEKFWQLHDPYGCLAAGDWIAGNVVITGGCDDEGATLSAPDWVITELESLCRS
jgi:hypothetical protein